MKQIMFMKDVFNTLNLQTNISHEQLKYIRFKAVNMLQRL